MICFYQTHLRQRLCNLLQGMNHTYNVFYKILWLNLLIIFTMIMIVPICISICFNAINKMQNSFLSTTCMHATRFCSKESTQSLYIMLQIIIKNCKFLRLCGYSLCGVKFRRKQKNISANLTLPDYVWVSVLCDKNMLYCILLYSHMRMQ